MKQTLDYFERENREVDEFESYQLIRNHYRFGEVVMQVEVGEVYKLTGMTFTEYRALPMVSQSDLKAANENPQLFEETRIKRIFKPPEKREFDFGRRMEATLKAGSIDDAVIIIPPDVLTSNGAKRGKAWDAFKQEHADEILVTEKEYENEWFGFERGLLNVREHEYANALLYAQDNLWSTRWTWYDGDHDLPMKAELDIVNARTRVIVDVKTANEIDGYKFARDAIKWGYDVQAACYLEPMAIRDDGEIWRYFWVVIRNKAPFDVAVYQLTDDVLHYGQERLERYKHRFRSMRDSGVWRPESYGTIQEFHAPWLFNQKENG